MTIINDPQQRLREVMRQQPKLPRTKYSGSYLDCKKFFRTGYPPSASVFDTEFFKKRDKAFKHFKVFIDSIENIWDKTNISLTFGFNLAEATSVFNADTGFKNLLVNQLTIEAFFLEENWRIHLAEFYFKHWEPDININNFWIIFLMSETGYNIPDDDFITYLYTPLSWLVSIADPLIWVKNEEVL